jgi:hypothetical protein
MPAPSKTPPASSKPPLEDPLYEKEIFASEVSSVGVRHGNIVITLVNLRFEEATKNKQAKARRIVAGRIVLTNPAAGVLMQSLQRLAAQLGAAAKTPASPTPS